MRMRSILIAGLLVSSPLNATATNKVIKTKLFEKRNLVVGNAKSKEVCVTAISRAGKTKENANAICNALEKYNSYYCADKKNGKIKLSLSPVKFDNTTSSTIFLGLPPRDKNQNSLCAYAQRGLNYRLFKALRGIESKVKKKEERSLVTMDSIFIKMEWEKKGSS